MGMTFPFDFMPKKKVEVLCTIPLPMPMERAVEVLRGLETAFAGKTYLRNGPGCWEVFRYVEDNIDTLPGLREAAGSELPLQNKKEKT
jgi:hypothetical protein